MQGPQRRDDSRGELARKQLLGSVASVLLDGRRKPPDQRGASLAMNDPLRAVGPHNSSQSLVELDGSLLLHALTREAIPCVEGLNVVV